VGLLLLRLAVGANRRRGRRVQEDDRRIMIMIAIGLASIIIDLFSIRRNLAASPRCVRASMDHPAGYDETSLAAAACLPELAFICTCVTIMCMYDRVISTYTCMYRSIFLYY
jgi:hypothetical protein